MYLFLDTESGGPGPEYSLLEFCLLKVDTVGKSFWEAFDISCVPNDDKMIVSRGGLKINQLDLTKFDHAITYKEAGTRLYQKLEEWGATPKTTTVVGHGIKGDLDILFKYVISKNSWLNFVSAITIDTGTIAKTLQILGKIPQDNQLSVKSLYLHYFGITHGIQWHTSRGDAVETYHIFDKMLKDLGDVQA